MKAGLTNLDTIRKHLLASSLGAETKFDTVLTAIGLGVAAAFDKFCNRKLVYTEDAEVIFTGDRDHFVLPHYPVVAISSIQTRYNSADAWEDATSALVNSNSASGLIQFYGQLGDRFLQVRVVYTGGYWFNQYEPDDPEFPGELPAGASELPADVTAAFLLQLEHVWQNKDRLGVSIVEKERTEQPKLAALKLVPLVQDMLKGHQRSQLT
jgi:hypothetical protein